MSQEKVEEGGVKMHAAIYLRGRRGDGDYWGGVEKGRLGRGWGTVCHVERPRHEGTRSLGEEHLVTSCPYLWCGGRAASQGRWALLPEEGWEPLAWSQTVWERSGLGKGKPWKREQLPFQAGHEGR